jgi:hypothetical protein
VYRPQPVPRVLQTKKAFTQTSASGHFRQTPLAGPKTNQPARVVQPKSNMRPAIQTGSHPAARGGYAQAFQRKQVVQLAQQSWQEQRYGKDWPPQNNPPQVPPTPSGQYYQEGAYYHEEQGNLDAFDAYIDQHGSFFGTSVGQTFGSQENEDYDASYVDIPNYARPSAPQAKNLWNQVYAGLALVPANNNLMQVACAEKNDGQVQVDAKTKVEVGKNAKPPMCHIIAFNHIRWAAEYIHTNPNDPLIGSKYKGPDPTNYPNDTWKNLVWHPSNLRPGHSKCNSQTATQAKGIPSAPLQKTAILYAVGRLKALEPTWF